MGQHREGGKCFAGVLFLWEAEVLVERHTQASRLSHAERHPPILAAPLPLLCSHAGRRTAATVHIHTGVYQKQASKASQAGRGGVSLTWLKKRAKCVSATALSMSTSEGVCVVCGGGSRCVRHERALKVVHKYA